MEKVEEMRVLLVEPGETPRVVAIPHTLEAMQELVGGTIACTYPWEDLVGLVHCDEAMDKGMLPNRMLRDEDGEIYDIVPGAFFIAGLTADSFCSIPDDLAEKYTELFRYPEIYVRTMDGHVVCLKPESDEPVIPIT